MDNNVRHSEERTTFKECKLDLLKYIFLTIICNKTCLTRKISNQKYRENKGHGKFPNVYDELFNFVTICRALCELQLMSIGSIRQIDFIFNHFL